MGIIAQQGGHIDMEKVELFRTVLRLCDNPQSIRARTEDSLVTTVLDQTPSFQPFRITVNFVLTAPDVRDC